MDAIVEDASDFEFESNKVLAKLDYFTEIQIWPLRTTINPSAWLSNFKHSEKRHAAALLNAFVYFSEPLVEQMFFSAFHNLSNVAIGEATSFVQAREAWQHFLNTVLITYVSGELPNPTDSGFIFARKSRQILGISEKNILHPADAIKTMLYKQMPIVFVDDFVGSGDQFINSFDSEYEISGCRISFRQLSEYTKTPFFYCPLVCTEHGATNIATKCPKVKVLPAHLVSNRYNALGADSIIWPKELQENAASFLFEASMRAGIPDCNGGVNDWRGYHKLGLALAFHHSTPDASLPILYWEKNGWQPLIRRI